MIFSLKDNELEEQSGFRCMCRLRIFVCCLRISTSHLYICCISLLKNYMIVNSYSSTIYLLNSSHCLQRLILHFPSRKKHWKIPDSLFSIYSTWDDTRCTLLYRYTDFSLCESTWTYENKAILMISQHLSDPNEHHRDNSDRIFRRFFFNWII